VTTPLPGSSTLAVGFHWPPTCPRCNWVGEFNDRQSPYIACGGDPDDPRTWPAAASRHRRPPVRTVRVQAPSFAPVPQPVPAAYQARPSHTRGGPRPVLGRGTCPVCGLSFAVRGGGSAGAVLNTHGPAGNRCPGSENPPAATPQEPT
jgi:hypothetical protein